MSEQGTPPGGGGMGGRFVRGALYVGAANWTTYALNFVIGILVARILGPEAFGVYAFVVAVNEFVNIVNGLAVAPALVQSREESETLYDTGYAISFGQALVGLVVCLAAAPLLASQRSAESAWFLVLLGFARFPILLADVVMARLDRHVRYGVIASIQLATRTLPNLVCLWLAWLGTGALSLILRDLMVALFPFLMAHLWSRWWFRGRISRGAFRRIMSYSGPMFLARSIDILTVRLDRLVVGWMLGNRAVGLYHQSRFIADAGLLATTPVTQVTFNLYSRLQDQTARLARSFSLVNTFLARFFFGAAAALLIAPDETIRLLLGEEWMAAAPALRVLGFYAGVVTVLQNVQILLYARGVIFGGIQLRVVQLAVLVPGVLLAAWRDSLAGVALAVMLSTLLALGVGWALCRDVVRGFGRRIFAVPSACLAATAAGFWLARGLTAQLPFWLMPFLPPLVFFSLLLLAERRQLFDEVRYLRAQLSNSRP